MYRRLIKAANGEYASNRIITIDGVEIPGDSFDRPMRPLSMWNYEMGNAWERKLKRMAMPVQPKPHYRYPELWENREKKKC
jgi:hypothetical protein